MKKIVALLFAACAATAAFAAESLPVFNATLTVGKEHRFVLVNPAGKSSGFLALGESFDGYKLKAYDAKATALDLERDGQVSRIALVADAGIANAPATATRATLADAEEVFRVMRFEEMMGKILEQQKKAMGPMMQQARAQAMGRGDMSEEDKAAITAFQQKAFDEMMSSIMGPEMRADMVKAYSEIFTKEELNSLGAFYATPAGQALIDKTPEVQAKLQASMMPRLMQSMQKMQQSSRDFMADLKAKHDAAPAAPAPVPSAPPAGKP